MIKHEDLDQERGIDPAIVAIVTAMEDQDASATQKEANQDRRLLDANQRMSVLALSSFKALHRSGPLREWLDTNVPADARRIGYLTSDEAAALLTEARQQGFCV